MGLRRCEPVLVWAVILVASAARGYAATFELTREALSRTAIFVGPEPSDAGRRDGDSTWIDRFAARELAHYLALALGAEKPIPILSADEPVGWPIRIAVGGPKTNTFIRRLCRAQLSSYVSDGEWRFPPGADAADGFVIIAAEDEAAKTLVLGGNLGGGANGEEPSDPATLYAVYHFLERCVDYGFFPDGIRVPRKPRVTFAGQDVQTPRFRDRFYRLSLAADGPQAFSPRKWSGAEWVECFRWMAQRKLNIALIDLSGTGAGRPERDPPSSDVAKAFTLARQMGLRFAYRIDEPALRQALDLNAVPEMLGVLTSALGPADYWILPLPVRSEDGPEDLVFRWADILAAVEAVSPGAASLLDPSAWLRSQELGARDASDPFGPEIGFVRRWLQLRRSLYVLDPFTDLAPWWPRADELADLPAPVRAALRRGEIPPLRPRELHLEARLRELLPEGLHLATGIVHSYAQDQQIHGDLDILARLVREAAREVPDTIPGIALLADSPGHNFVFCDRAARLAWDPWTPASLADFFSLYCRLRFGGHSVARLSEAEALAHEATRAYCLPYLFTDTRWPLDTSTGRMFHRNLPFGDAEGRDGGHPESFPLLADREAWLEARERVWRTREVLPRLAKALSLYLSCAAEQRNDPHYRNSLVELCRTYLGELNNWHLAAAYRAYRAATAAFSSGSPVGKWRAPARTPLGRPGAEAPTGPGGYPPPSRDPTPSAGRFAEEAARALRCLVLLAELESSDPRFSGVERVDGPTTPTGYSARWLVEEALSEERAYCRVLADRLQAGRSDPLVSSQWVEVQRARKRIGPGSPPAAPKGSPVDEAVRILGELAVQAETGLDTSVPPPLGP